MTIVNKLFKVINRNMFEEEGEPTEDDLKRFRAAAKKMVQSIKDRAPDWEDPEGTVEDAFYDNMIAMKKGEL